MFPRLLLAVLTLPLLAIATPVPAPIDPGLQPIIAYKNNIGLINPPTPNSNGAAVRGVSGALRACGRCRRGLFIGVAVLVYAAGRAVAGGVRSERGNEARRWQLVTIPY
ncbi:hypothetical protein B0H13DRAFT_2311005 [Mycena leptocephala]|nr:hypothetical protein B0H13DRAFT_2311005 [Mycena leptocephala]